MKSLANFEVQKQNSKSDMTLWSKKTGTALALITIVLVGPSLLFSSVAYAQQGVVGPEKTTKTRHDDFFKHKERVKNQNAAREKGRSLQKAKRIKAQEQYEQSRINYVQKRKDGDAQRREARAEAWILEQRIKDEKQREKAKKEYLAKKESNLNHVIPENVEYDISPPPVDLNKSKPAPAPRGSGRLRF